MGLEQMQYARVLHIAYYKTHASIYIKAAAVAVYCKPGMTADWQARHALGQNDIRSSR